MKKLFILCIYAGLALLMSRCCILMPNARTSYVTVKTTPSNASIYNSSGRLLGTGTCQLKFDCSDKKYDSYTIKVSAPDYKTKTERVSNLRYDYTQTITLNKLAHYSVELSVDPANADIYENGNKIGNGSYKFDFTEEDSSDSYYEVYLEAPYYYSETVRVYKSDGRKTVSMNRKPIKTIVVIPADADIFVNNEPVGKGKYDVSFENTDKVMITVSRIGYESATYTLLKNNPNQTITYELDVDEAYENSEGGESASQYANKWVPIKIRPGLSDDEAWLRMMSIVRENFEQIEKTDKSSGWIKTFPAITAYKASDVRTVLEIVPDFSTGEKKYKVRLSFEKRQKGSGEEGWAIYDRLMKKYKDVIPNLLNSVGGGM